MTTPATIARSAVFLAAGLVFLGLPACKSDKKQSAERADQAVPASPAVSAPAPGGERVFRAGDGTAAGRALGVITTVDVPRLVHPACADYELNTRSLFRDLDYQLRRLRTRAGADADKGVPLEELGQLVGWLDARAGMLEQIARSRAMREHELGRAHLELTGAFADLANAFGQAYDGQDGEPEPEAALRLGNAADNFAAALRALEVQCNEPSP